MRHSALEPGEGYGLGEARLTDRQRLGVLMQGCALLSHLERGGWRLERGWRGAKIDDDGVLRAVAARPGRSPVLAQDALRSLLGEIFALAARSRGERSRRAGGAIPGRGEARHLARRLDQAWDQRLTRVRPDRAVATVLDHAHFLWREEHGPARTALVAEHRMEGGRFRHTVSGRWAFEARLLAGSRDLTGLEGRLAGPRAVELWRGEAPPVTAMKLSAAGRWSAAVAAWRIEPPSGPEEALALAGCLERLARFEEALVVLRGMDAAEARILKASCLEATGAARAARRVLDRLSPTRLSPAQRIAAAEVELRVAARLGGHGRGGSASRLPSRLLRAEAAWQRRDLRSLGRHFSRRQSAGRRGEPMWRWRRLRSLAALEAGRLELGRAGLDAALGSSRRDLDRSQAAALWCELGLARGLTGDLRGADRALQRSVRLLGGMGSGRAASPAWQALAEIRLRIGRPRGVRRYLRQAEAATRRSGDLGSRLRVATLRARYELFMGRPAEALAVCRRAGTVAPKARLAQDRDLLALLAGRALGWLGRQAESRDALEACGNEVWPRLEPEERASAWLVAGEPARACRKAQGGPLAGLFLRLAEGSELTAGDWRAVEALGRYRAARLIFDLSLVAGELIPARRQRQAARRLRHLGADFLAGRLERRGDGPWRALRAYAESADSRASWGLLRDAGYPEIRLTWSDGATEIPVVRGAGGREGRSEPCGSGRLTLSAESIDEPLEALFALLCRDYRPARGARPVSRSPRGGILGESPSFLAALDRADRLAKSDLPLLLEGETGTGKELVAKRAHRLSRRRERPLLAINCAALPESLLLADLFGHVRGAFTGADRDRKGIFEAADGGTVLLDEVGDLPTSAQGKLLRVLQEGEVRRVGESRVRRVDVRILAATHRCLARMVAEGGFREDLHFRLGVGHVRLPPLRERGEDVVLLAERFLEAHGRELDPGAHGMLTAHGWPGNVRELKNVVDVAVAMADGRRIGPGELELPSPRSTVPDEVRQSDGYHAQVESFRRRLVERALEESGGVRSEAARRLGLSRQAISYLTARFGID